MEYSRGADYDLSFRPLTGNYISQWYPKTPTKKLRMVSVPLRGTTFLNYIDISVRDELRVSVPLRGTTFLNGISTVMKSIERAVSVPLRGTTFLNSCARKRHGRVTSFRPLTGNYISQCHSNLQNTFVLSFRPLTGNYISQSWQPMRRCGNLKFPSPYGELHFSILWIESTRSKRTLVSVPLRGTTFLNHNCNYSWSIYNSFRPLTGNYISQSGKRNSPLIFDTFPSPYGELHFSMYHGECSNKILNRFRPLTGNYISQYVTIDGMEAVVKSFRPLTGNYISQSYIIDQKVPEGCFRPLTGNYISQWSCLSRTGSWSTKFPSPYGELHFSIRERPHNHRRQEQFPSPYGELHFSIYGDEINRMSLKVSVPLRGTTFLNGNRNCCSVTLTLVSVPLRGTTFLNEVLRVL